MARNFLKVPRVTSESWSALESYVTSNRCSICLIKISVFLSIHILKHLFYWFFQLLDTGFFHADPHPGNMIRTPDGKLAILDFGNFCPVTETRFSSLEVVDEDFNCSYRPRHQANRRPEVRNDRGDIASDTQRLPGNCQGLREARFHSRRG